MNMNTHKKLYRDLDRAMLAGVMVGLADYFNQDVTVWRLGAAIFLVLTGLMPGVLIYILAWFIIPAKSKGVRDAEYRVVEE